MNQYEADAFYFNDLDAKIIFICLGACIDRNISYLQSAMKTNENDVIT